MASDHDDVVPPVVADRVYLAAVLAGNVSETAKIQKLQELQDIGRHGKRDICSF